MILHLLAEIGRFLSSVPFVLFVLACGYLFVGRDSFGRIITLTLFTIIYNYSLKYQFKMPLPEPIAHKGYGFPSSHTHVPFICYFMLAMEYKKPIGFVIAGIVTALIGHALVYFDYHFVIDIFGAVAFGSFSIFIFTRLLKTKIIQACEPLLMWGAMPLAAFFLILIPSPLNYPHLWDASGAMLGVAIGWTCCFLAEIDTKKQFQAHPIAYPLFSLATIAGVFFAIHKGPDGWPRIDYAWEALPPIATNVLTQLLLTITITLIAPSLFHLYTKRKYFLKHTISA